MAITIGAEPGSNFDNPIGLLTDCHRRIEKFIHVIQTVTSQASGRTLNDEQRQAFEVALRYFRDSAPKHAADEEESLFPRMMMRAGPDTRLISAVLERLNTEHRRLSECHERVEDLGRSWLAHEHLPALEVARLRALVEGLGESYSAHIAVEENEIFPRAVRILEADDLLSIANEMAERRGLLLRDFVSHRSK